MKQTGTYHIYKVENNIRVISPIANAYLYFIQNDAIKLTAKTDDKGKFNFDLPLGSYIVGSASEGGIEQILANGSKFTLDASSTLDAFEKWINAPAADVDSELLKRFRELAKQSQDAADEAQEILKQMQDGSIGSGKWVRNSIVENMLNIGDYGLGSRVGATLPSGTTLENIPQNGFYRIGGNSPIAPPGLNQSGDSALVVAYSKNLFSILYFGADKYRYSIYSKGLYSAGRWTELLTNFNTTVDSNGFVKKASPIIKLFDDKVEPNDQFYDDPVFEKIGVGTYKISNTKGLAKDGWTYEKPRGGDGTPYFRINVIKLDDGCIVSVHDEYEAVEQATIVDSEGKERTINKVVKILGEARDIQPNERWIDLRFEEDHERVAQEEEEARLQMEKEELERAEAEEAKRLAEEEAEIARKLEEERILETELME